MKYKLSEDEYKKSILEIEINEEKFKAYEKYCEEVEKTPNELINMYIDLIIDGQGDIFDFIENSLNAD